MDPSPRGLSPNLPMTSTKLLQPRPNLGLRKRKPFGRLRKPMEANRRLIAISRRDSDRSHFARTPQQFQTTGIPNGRFRYDAGRRSAVPLPKGEGRGEGEKRLRS